MQAEDLFYTQASQILTKCEQYMQSRPCKKRIFYYCLALTLIFSGYLASPIRIHLAGISADVIEILVLSIVVILVGFIIAWQTFLFGEIVTDLDWIPAQLKFFLKWLFWILGSVTVVIGLYFSTWGFSLSTASPVGAVTEAVTDSEGFSYITYKIPGGARGASNYELRKERILGPGIIYSKVLCKSENYPGIYIQEGKVRVSCDKK